jgi:hypothetical protein
MSDLTIINDTLFYKDHTLTLKNSRYTGSEIKELILDGDVCFTKGVLTFDELFRKYWYKKMYTLDRSNATFREIALVYMSEHHPEELI